MTDIKQYHDKDIGVTHSLRSLKRSHIHTGEFHKLLRKVNKSPELLQEQKAPGKVTKQMEIMMTSQQDTVPLNIRFKKRARDEEMLKTWKNNNDKMFIKTRAAEHVFKCIKENSCVTIIGSSGVGKTAILRHVALRMKDKGYDVLMVTKPDDIVKYNNPNRITLFVFDDLCGIFSVDLSDIKRWDPVMKNIKMILEKKQTKILAACRLQVYQDEKFKSLSVFKSCVSHLLSKNICLTKTEKQSLAELYLKSKASEITGYYDLYEYFPLLCKLYHENHQLFITNFFQNPFTVYEAEVQNFFEKGHHSKYCALALCVIFNNRLKVEILTEEVNEETRIIIENTCEACRLYRKTSRLVLQYELDSLTHTFIKKEQNMYKIIHDKIFDFLAKIYGTKIIDCLIKNADSGLIKERFLLDRKNDMDQFITIIPQKYHHLYIQRMVDDWSKGKLQDVFSNINMKIPHFRQKFLFYLNTLDMSYQRQLANICDDNDDNNDLYHVHYDTALLHCCDIGDISLVQWCCNQGVNVNRCTYYGGSSVIIACKYGHTKIVKMLLDKEADFNKKDFYAQSPVMKACEHGHAEIVKMLLDRGVDYNKFDEDGQSPVMKACEHGHAEIVNMLLDKGVDYNKCDKDGESPLMKACKHGHTEIVKMLLDIGVDYNKCDKDGQSPLMKACQHVHTEIVVMLLDKDADYNKFDRKGESPMMKACEHGHIEIVKLLLDSGADYNKCDEYGQSPLMKACENGHTKIVKMLLDRGADYNKCDWLGQLVLMYACKYGHTEIVKIMIDIGVDYEKCDSSVESPVIKACQNGHTEIVKMLLDRGVDYNKCDMRGESPVTKACQHGHTEIVKMLLDKGTDYDKFDKNGQSPLMKACEHGHTEIVKMLLDRGSDYNKCDEHGQSPLMKGCEHGYTEVVKMLLVIGVDYNKCEKDGQSPLMKACQHGHTKIVKMLLDRGADYNKCDSWGKSPLTKACKYGHTEIVKILLDRGADYNKYDWRDESPVMKACQNGHTEIVKMFLNIGVVCKICDSDSQSPERLTEILSHAKIVKVLLDKVADYEHDDNDGQSPVKIGRKHGPAEIVNMEVDREADFSQHDNWGLSSAMMTGENDYTERDARSSVPMDCFCDGIHLVCFTDTRLEMKSVLYANSIIKEHDHDKALKRIVYEDPTIPDFVKLTFISGLIKRKECSQKSWEDMLLFTTMKNKPVLCYFLLANVENIMITDQPNFHDILQQALCNAMTNQDKETAIGISWFILRNFYRSLSSSVKETIIDTWPSFECKCDNIKTVTNFCSSSMIIIIETGKVCNDFPLTFWKVNLKYIINDKTDKNECKEVHKKLQTSLSEVHFLNKVVISGVDAKTLFTEHSNLTLICKSAFKSKGFLKNEHEFVDIPCVQLYCKSKGVIPVGESHFPKTICGLQTDILEGSPCYLAGIRVGDEIGTDEFKRGTLGGFLLIRGVKTFLTCLHVFLNADELSADNISLNDEKLSMVKLYPRSSAVQNSHECGYIRDIAFQVDNEKETSIDVALIEFTSGTSIDSQDYMALDNGKLSYVDVGMNSDYLNNSCVDYRPLCFSTPRPILQTVSVGAVSGFSDCKISEVLENKEKFVDLESIEDLYSNVVLDEVRAKAKLIISYFQSITLANIPDEQTIVQYIEQTCDPDISAEIKVILCNIVKNVYLKLQSNTNECVENIIQEVSLHHTHSSFSAIIGNVHMQKVFIRKTGDNMAVKRIKRRVYNQLHISNIPFKPGDSGTCIYVLSPVRGCIGMAIANHPLGGCIATPIMEILKHFKIGIK